MRVRAVNPAQTALTCLTANVPYAPSLTKLFPGNRVSGVISIKPRANAYNSAYVLAIKNSCIIQVDFMEYGKRKVLVFFCLCILLGARIVIQRDSIDSQDGNSKNWYREEKLLFYGIPVTIKFYPNNPALGQKIWGFLDEINDIFNDYNNTSEIGVINDGKSSDPAMVSPLLKDAFTKSTEIYEQTNGAFDVSVKSLKMLWQKKEQDNALPTKDDIESVLDHCGLDKVFLEKNSLKRSSSKIKFDFGGIVKGIAVDSIISILRQNDVQSALIQIGGETAVFGMSPKQMPFVIGIQDPKNLSELWTAVADQGNGLSISTSGNYRNSIQIGDKEYYHIINPKTGWPVDNTILSVSVIFSSTGKNWMADSLTTASVVLGPEKTMPILSELGGEIMFLINDQNQIREIKSKGWDLLRSGN